jgi:hypothetical protein
MATITKTANIGVYQNGSIFTVTVDFVKNSGPDTATGVKVVLTIPDGIDYSSSSLSQGTYNSGTDTWTIGSLLAGQSVSATFSFLVTDDCEGPYSIYFTATTTGGCESCITNNVLCIVASGFSCCEDCDDKIQTITDDYTVLLTDKGTILADGSDNEITITLPTPASAYTEGRGKKFVFKALDTTNQIRLFTPSGKIVCALNIEDSTDTQGVNFTGDYITIQSDGVNYYCVSGVLSTPTVTPTLTPTTTVTPSITATTSVTPTITPTITPTTSITPTITPTTTVTPSVTVTPSTSPA